MARCSFCGRPHESVRRLILGPSVAICADCVRTSMKMLEEDDGGVVPTEGQIVVRFLDGSICACELRGDWHAFAYEAYALEWCAAFAPAPPHEWWSRRKADRRGSSRGAAREHSFTSPRKRRSPPAEDH